MIQIYCFRPKSGPAIISVQQNINAQKLGYKWSYSGTIKHLAVNFYPHKKPQRKS